MKGYFYILAGVIMVGGIISGGVLTDIGRNPKTTHDISVGNIQASSSYDSQHHNSSGQGRQQVGATVSVGKGLKLYQNDGTTLIGYFLGYESQDFISPLPACQRLTYSTIGTGTVNVAGLYGCQGSTTSNLWFPNTTCAGSAVYSNVVFAPGTVLVQNSTGAWLTSANNGNNVIIGPGTFTYSRYSGGSCITGSVTFVDNSGFANGASFPLISSLCGGGPCKIK